MYSYNNLRQPVNNMYARSMNNKMNNNMYICKGDRKGSRPSERELPYLSSPFLI